MCLYGCAYFAVIVFECCVELVCSMQCIGHHAELQLLQYMHEHMLQQEHLEQVFQHIVQQVLQHMLLHSLLHND